MVALIFGIQYHLLTHFLGLKHLILEYLFLLVFLFQLCFGLLEYLSIKLLPVIFGFHLQLLTNSNLLVKDIPDIPDFLQSIFLLLSQFLLVQTLTKFLNFTPLVLADI